VGERKVAVLAVVGEAADEKVAAARERSKVAVYNIYVRLPQSVDMSIPRLAIHRPVTMFMISGIVVLLGAISLTRLPVDLMPEFEPHKVREIYLMQWDNPHVVVDISEDD
jgi:hypothetical protein